MASRLDGGGCGRHRRVVARGSVDLCEREHGLDGEFWRGELISLEDAPAWIQYPGILTGYRRAPRTWKGCLRTVFSLHNESGNIWTHVIASVWMIELFRRIVLGKFAEPGVADPIVTFVIGAMLLAALLCYSVSTIYHLFGYLDRETYRMLYVLDQKGILASLAANHAGAISVLFEARPQLRLVLLTLSFAIFIGTQNLCVNYERSDDLDGRNRLFSFSAAWVLPTIYPLAWFLEPEIFDKFLPTLVTCFSINFMACFFFSTRWPETRFPGKVRSSFLQWISPPLSPFDAFYFFPHVSRTAESESWSTPDVMDRSLNLV